MNKSKSLRHGKSSNRVLRAAVFATPAVAAMAFAPKIQAAALYWDTNGAALGAGTTPTGNWGVDAFWNDQLSGDGAGIIGPWIDGSDAVFSAGGDASGPYTVTVTGTQTAASIALEEGNLTLSGGEINLTGASTVDVASGLTLDVGSVISGSTGLTKTGAGIAILNGVNTYTGGTTLGGGTVAISADANLGAGTVAYTANSTLQVNGSFTTNRAHNITSGVTATWEVTGANTATFSGGVTGNAGTPTKAGPGTLTLGGVVTGTGGYNVTGGTLILNHTGNTVTGAVFVTGGGVLQIPTSAPIGGTGAGSGNITLDNGTFRNTNAGVGGTFLTGNRGIIIGPSGGTIDTQGTAATIQIYTSGSITGPGNTVTKVGLGTFRFTTPTASTFSKLVVNAGLWQGGALDTVFGAVPTVLTPDQITLNGGGISTNAGVTITANRGILLGAAGGTINTPSSPSIAGPISGVGSLTKTATNTLTLTNSTNSYSGDTHLTAGTITLDGDGTLGNGAGTLNLAARLNISANRNVTTDPVLNPINLVADSSITTTSTAATVNLNLSSDSITSTAGTLTFRNDGAAGTGLFDPRFSGDNFNFTRPIVIAAGSVDPLRTTRLSSFNDTGSIQTFSGVISGPGSYRRSEFPANTGGDTIFTAPNTYSGGTQLSGGGIGLGLDSVGTGLGVTSGPIGTGLLTVAASGGNAKLFAVGGPRILGNNITFTSSPLVLSGTNDITLSGDVSLGAGSRTIQVDNANVSLTGVISGTTGITKTGTGTATLTNANTYSAQTWVDGGILSVSSPGNLGDGSTTNGVALFSGTLLATAPLASSSRNVDLNNGGTIESAHPVSFGNVAGSGSLTKAGTGTLSVNHVRGDNLAINAGRVQIVQNQSDAGVSVLNTIGIGATEALDLTDNHVISHVTPVGTWNGTNYDGLTGQIASGRNGNTLPLWDGPGVVTSMSDATGGNFTSIGIATGTEVLLSRGLTAADTLVWAGQTISASDALVMYTYGGDANLDGKLNIDDYVAIDQGIASTLTGWSNGDFNYDGKVNIDDYTTVIDSNIGNQVLGQFYNAGGIGSGGGSGVSAVPEPAGMFAVGLGALGWLGSRRRKNEKALQT